MKLTNNYSKGVFWQLFDVTKDWTGTYPIRLGGPFDPNFLDKNKTADDIHHPNPQVLLFRIGIRKEPDVNIGQSPALWPVLVDAKDGEVYGNADVLEVTEDGNLRKVIPSISGTPIRCELNLTWRCWIQVTNQFGPSWIELAPSTKIYLKNTEHRYNSLINSNETLPNITRTIPGGNIPKLKWKVEAWFGSIGIVSQEQDTPEVAVGYRTTITLHFKIDATSYSATDLGFLDLDIPAGMKGLTRFYISRQSKVTNTKYSSPLTTGPQNTYPWMNGYLEKYDEKYHGAAPFELFSVAAVDQWTEIFPKTADHTQFWAINAAPNTSNIWHFSENSTSSFVDMGIPITSNINYQQLFKLYPDRFGEAVDYRTRWSQEEDLDDPAIQSGSFGAISLPLPGESIVKDFWDAVIEGKLAFDPRMPNACYNWEVFFHAPLLIADHLSRQQKFEAADRWLRSIFDPTNGEAGSDARRFLKFRPFKELDPLNNVAAALTALAREAAHPSSGQSVPDAVQAVKDLIEEWRNAPFRPFLIARRRILAFLWQTIFAYLENLIAWADSLYRQDRRESINEATMLYVLAMRLLGKRPRVGKGDSKRPSLTYADVAGKWDDFANVWIDLAMSVTKNITPGGKGKNWDEDTLDTAGMLYFCIPFNDKIASYWNAIEDRLFNIRHCRNIDGITRDLPLTDPPIDPELLIRATAAGLDLGDVIAGLYAPMPHYRFGTLFAKASELISEVKALGAAMLAANEKRDAEKLSLLRSSNEIELLRPVRDVREQQIEEAKAKLGGIACKPACGRRKVPTLPAAAR
ncbi:MAG: hypothetical protein IPG76_00310 [Acidobacteria bacterium]|nr:hypothetical protein [Acidobacteriota bacterium]